MNIFRIVFLLLFLFIVALAPVTLLCQSESEGLPESYILRPVGARAVGLDGAYTAVVNEPNALFINPGALSSQSENLVVHTMFSALSFNRYQATLAAAK